MSDSVLTYLDTYCERAGNAGAFAEPLNLFTNAFFILAALLAARALYAVQREHRGASPHVKTMDVWLLVAALFSIGMGSGLWHFKPSHATLLMDVIPITLFINIFLVAALRRLFAFSWPNVVCGWAVYFVAGLIAQFTLPPNLLNGTIMYIPTYATLLLMTFGLRRRDALTGRAFGHVVAVFSLSLLLRTVDLKLCTQTLLPFGTHFLWHSLNAWVLWRLLMLLIGRAKTV